MTRQGVARARKDGRGRPVRIPWDSLRDEYIHGDADARGRRRYPSQRELSEKYACAETQVSRISARENWVDKREEFSMRILEERTQKLAEDLANKAIEADMAMYQVAMGTLQQVARRVKEAHERQELIPSSVVKDMAVSIRHLQTAVRLALGQETESVRHDGQLTLVDYVRVIDAKGGDADRGDATPVPKA
jgi:hypothetical protein